MGRVKDKKKFCIIIRWKDEDCDDLSRGGVFIFAGIVKWTTDYIITAAGSKLTSR